MEFSQRGFRPNQASGTEGSPSASGGHHNGKTKKGRLSWMNLSTVVLMISVSILILSVIAYAFFGRPTKESEFVDSNQYQAVFLSGGQVYFGKISDLNQQYMTLDNIYYLRVNQQVQPKNSQQSSNDVSLVKLGCELHGPQDQMVINRDQIIFWENLKSDGQVAKAVAEYQKQNPQGQQCQTNTNNNTNTNNTNNGSNQ